MESGRYSFFDKHLNSTMDLVMRNIEFQCHFSLGRDQFSGKKAAQYFDNAEIIELHHNQKKDAPSGTAVKTAQLMAQEKSDFAKNNCAETELIEGSRGGTSYSNIHIHSVRMPGFIASQEVLFGAAGQIMTIRHDSMDRECYMSGVILAVNHVFNNSGFVYGLDNIL